MHQKSIQLTGIKTGAGLAEGEFVGLASTFGNVDHGGDRVMPGAFAKSLDTGEIVPILWEHQHGDPRMQVGEIKSAHETAEGLEIRAQLDLDNDYGRAAYRSVKSRRVKSLSIGYSVRHATKGADGVQELRDVDLIEVSLVARPANDRATISAVKSTTTTTTRARLAAARLNFKENNTMPKKTTFDDLIGASTPRSEVLTKARDEQVKIATDIVALAEELKRDLTADEVEQVEAATAKARDLDARLKTAKADEDVLAGMRDLVNEIGGVPGGSGSAAVPSTKSGYLQLTGKGAKRFAAQAAAGIAAKGLTTAGQLVSTLPVAPEVHETGRPPTSVLDVLNAQVRPVQYGFIRQSARAMAAAVVPEGAEKPESTMGVTTVQQTLKVIAHLSEPIPKYTLHDASNLERFVEDELVWGLRRAVEAQVLNGDGDVGAENMLGIVNASGIQSQAFSATALESIRKAITKLEANGYAADVLVLSATDWEAIELAMASTTAVIYRGVPIDAVQRRLWGVQCVLSTALPVKTAALLDRSALAVDHDGNVEIRWSETGDDFEKNMVRARVEGRFNWSLYKPQGVVKIGTAA